MIPFLTAAWLMILLILTSSQASANPESPPGNPDVLVLTDAQGKYPLGLHLEILEDPSGTLTIKDVSSPAFNSKFVPSEVAVPNYGYTSSVYWVRFHLDNQTHQTSEWLLELGFVYLQYVDLYSPSPDAPGFRVKQTGALRPVSTRDIPFPRLLFNLSVPTPSQQTYYLRFKNEGSMTLPLTLWAKDTFWVQSQPVQMRDWLFLGALLTLLVYHLFLYFSLRDLRYLFFVILLAGMFAHLSTLAGYLQVYIFPGLYQVKPYGVWFPIFAYASVVLFSDAFWELRTRHPRLHWIHMGVLVGWVAIFILGALTTYHNTVRVVVPYALFSLVLTWIPWIASWRKSFAPSRFFVIAWLGMLISLFLVLVVRLRILPSMPLTEQLYQPGILLMAFGWSMALGNRVNLFKAETEEANLQMRSTELELSQILDGVPVGVAVYGKDEMPKYANKRVYEILGNPNRGIQPDPKSSRTLEQALDYFSFHIAGTDERYPLERLPVYRALRGDTSSADDLEADLVDRLVPIEMWASPIFDETGNITSAVTAFLDISRRKQTDAELDEYRKRLESLVENRTADLSAINNWLNAITEIHQTLGGAKELPEAYKKMSAAIAQLLEARAVFIVNWSEPLEHCEVHYASGEEFPIPRLLISRLKTSVVKDPVFYKGGSSGKPILLTADQKSVYSMVFADHLSQEEMQLFVLAPMITHQTVSGLLGIVFRDPKMEISQQQMLLMGKMALDVANLTRNAFLLDQSIELATLEERQRIARDLHDSVTQMIYSASLFSSTLPNRIRRDPESALEMADELHRLTRGALAEMRTLLLELRPTGIIRMPISELLTQLAQAIAGRSDFSLDLDVEDIPILPDGVQVVFYRIAQEALNNILKHANAKQAVLRLNTNPSLGSQAFEDWHGEIALTIEDDGAGFDPELINYEHFGLGIMQERADSIQAQFHLDSRSGGGTEVTLIWQR